MVCGFIGKNQQKIHGSRIENRRILINKKEDISSKIILKPADAAKLAV